MLNMSQESQDFLLENIPELLNLDDLDRILSELDAFITREGLDRNDDMTSFGHEAQEVYDDIFYSN